MIKFTWKRLSNVRKNDIKKAKSDLQSETLARRGREEPSSFVAAPWSMQTALATCPSFFSMMEAVPLYGSPVSLLWPFGGMSLGALANLCFKASFSPEQQNRLKQRFVRFGAPFTVGALSFGLLTTVRQVPETGRFGLTAKWPWMNEETVADLDPVFENFLASKVVNNGKPRWAGSVLSQLKSGNEDISLMADRQWKIKVLDESLAMLLCFVVPRSRNIWMSAYYLKLVDDDPQLAYVLGHELSHVICQHGKDFCFLETVREVLLLATGMAVGWCLMDGNSPETSIWHRVARFARFFAISGLSCVALAVVLNVCWVLPYRRKLELEADYCGLKFAAKACFKLQSIPGHWDTLNFAGTVPEWRSTHPTPMTRKAHLLKLLPWAEGFRSASGCASPYGK